MTRLAVLAAMSRACVATPACDTEADANSMLQTKSKVRKPKNAPQSAEAEALLQTVKGLANSLKNSEMTPEDANAAIGTAQAALGAMTPTFAEQQAIAQGEANRQFDEISTCEARADIAHHESTVTRHREARERCEEALAEANERQEQECSEWTSLSERLYDNLPDCDRPSSPGDLFDTVTSWVTLAQGADWASIASQRTSCHEARDAATERAQVCAAMTDAFVVAYCERTFACEHTLVGCHEQEVEVYNALRQDIESQVEAWQQQYRTVRQADCILNLITTSLITSTPIDNDSLTACDNVDVDDLAVTFRDPPPVPECAAPQNGDPQCDAPFRMEHSTWGEFTNVDDFQNDQLVWRDRPYVYRGVPEELRGATMFSGPHAGLSNGRLMFHTERAATLYVWAEINSRRWGERNGGVDDVLAERGWERVDGGPSTLDSSGRTRPGPNDFQWLSITSRCNDCESPMQIFKRDVGALEDVEIPLSRRWVGGAAAKLNAGLD